MIPVILSFLLLLLGKIKGGLTSSEKASPFECGFDPIVGLRSPFTTRYFLLVIIFLIFDVELSLMFPLISLYRASGLVAAMLPLSVAVVMLAGILHEKNEGRIQWINYWSYLMISLREISSTLRWYGFVR